MFRYVDPVRWVVLQDAKFDRRLERHDRQLSRSAADILELPRKLMDVRGLQFVEPDVPDMGDHV